MISESLLILAGGKATRLGVLSKNTPKFLMPVDDKKVFADLQLEWAAKQGFKKVILSLGYLGEQIEDYCEDGSKWGLQISYSHDGKIPLGTGGAVKKAASHLEQPFAVTYGDTLLVLDCAQLFKIFSQSSSLGLMTVFKNTVPGHVCNAKLDQGRVFYSKTNPQKDFEFIDYGFLILSPRFLTLMKADQVIDLALPLEEASAQGEILGFEAKERFWEMGSSESLEEFRKRYAKK